MTTATGNPVLELSGVSKRFAGVQALKNVGLTLRAGEVHALMGQNGAGKSTLIKVLTGVHTADTGDMRLAGQPIRPGSPLEAQAIGLTTVYQEVNLCPNLSVAENIFAGRFPRHGVAGAFRIDWKKVHADSQALLARLNLQIDVTRLLGSYPVAVQQMVAIARALHGKSRVLILDEPTSSLDADEVARLFALLRQLRGEGLAILFVTHFLDEVYEISDRITVLRNGERVGEYLASELNASALISAMIGREFQATAAPLVMSESSQARSALLQATGLGRRGAVNPLDIELRSGEVLGLAGLLGSGRTELARLLFGMDKADAGELSLRGQPLKLATPTQAVRHGLAMCPEDRKAEGIVADLSIRENIALALQARMGVWRSLSVPKQQALAERFIQQLGIKAPDADMPIGLLSGGNQQKALLARWLATEPALLILDEPTRGIDVAAKQDIMDKIRNLAREGLSVLFISSELDEIARLSDRVAVMRERHKAGELPGGSSEAAILAMIAHEPEKRLGMKRLTAHRLFWPLATLVLMLAVNASFNPGFWQLHWRDGHLYGSLIDILNRAAPLAVVALGMTLVIATRGIDISVGAVVAICAAIAAWMIGGSLEMKDGVPVYMSRFPMWLALACALGVALAAGLWNGLLVAGAGIQPIIATLILMVAGRGIAQLITEGQIITIYYAPYFFIGGGYLLGLPFSLFIVAAMWLLLQQLLSRTALGLFIQAIGVNPAAARMAGVRQRLITICVYGFCGLCAGVAGLMLSSNVKSADGNNAGQLMELDAILAVTLGGSLLTGGRFSLAGSVIGALVIQTLTSTIYSIGVPPEVNLVVKAAVVFVVMLLQSAEFRRLAHGLVFRQAPGGRRMTTDQTMALDSRAPQAPDLAVATHRRAAWRLSPAQWPLALTMLLFSLMVGYGSFAYDGFFSAQVMLNLLIDNAFLAIVAVGMTFVILTGGIDLSVGSVIALTTMIVASLVEHKGWTAAGVIPLVLVLGTVFGAFQGWLIQRFRLQPFIVTLAGMFLARGLCYLISIDSISISNEAFSELAQVRFDLWDGASISIGAVIALAVVAAGIFVAHGTAFGRTVYAIGGSEHSAMLMGLPVARTTVLVYALSGFCSTLAGVVFSFYMLSGYGLHAMGLELDTIAAVVIGGTLLSGGMGYVAGTLFGVLILGVIQTLISFDGTLSSWWTRIVIGALLFAFCLLQRLFEIGRAGRT